MKSDNGFQLQEICLWIFFLYSFWEIWKTGALTNCSKNSSLAGTAGTCLIISRKDHFSWKPVCKSFFRLPNTTVKKEIHEIHLEDRFLGVEIHFGSHVLLINLKIQQTGGAHLAWQYMLAGSRYLLGELTVAACI